MTSIPLSFGGVALPGLARFFRPALVAALLIMAPAGAALAQAFGWQYAATPAQILTGNSVARATATDAAGDVYVTGYFSGQVSFGSATLTVAAGTAANASDIFIAKWTTATSTWAWAESAGGRGSDQGMGIAVNGSSVYVTGYITNNTLNTNAVMFGGTARPGASTTSSQDVFVAKYDAAGTYQWARTGGGTTSDVGNGIAATSTGVYATGNFTNANNNFSATQFGGSTLNGVSAAAGSDVFVVGYDAAGTYQWATAAGGTGTDLGYGIAVNGTELYVTGLMSNNIADANHVLFGNMALPGASTSNGSDIFVASYNTAGTYRWGHTAGGTGQDRGQAITVNSTGLYLTGTISSTLANASAVKFDGAPVAGASTTNSQDMFVARYDAAGVFQWANSAGGTDTDIGNAIAVSGANVYVTGAVQNTDVNASVVQFGGNALNGVGTANGSDVFVASYATSGTYQWARADGGNFTDAGYGIAASGAAVYVAGQLTPDAALGSFSFYIPTRVVQGFIGQLVLAPISSVVVGSGVATRPALTLYPNPTTTTGDITVTEARPRATVTAFDLLGRPVVAATADASGTAHLTLPAGLAPGVYLVRSGTQVQRLTVE